MAGSKNKKSVAEHSLVFMKYRLLKGGLLCEIVSYVVPGKKEGKTNERQVMQYMPVHGVVITE